MVDDGSTDFSGIICDSYSRKDSRFHVIHQGNKGVSAARNAGIEAATAPLLAFIDPDDIISTNYFELLIQKMRDIDASVAVSFFRLVQEDGAEGRFKETNQFMRYLEEKFPRRMMDNGAVVAAVAAGVKYSGASCGVQSDFPLVLTLERTKRLFLVSSSKQSERFMYRMLSIFTAKEKRAFCMEW